MGEILINQLFAGSYLSEGENIGHEIINLFQDDDGNNYLFITKNGIVKNHDVESVVFVQNIKARETMEVIMKAVGLTPVNKDEINSITYAGVRLVDIFKKNIYHGDKDMVDVFDMVTYKAKKIFFPRSDKKIILTVDSNYKNKNSTVVFIGDNREKIVGQSMRTYLSNKSSLKDYESMKKIINDINLWEKESSVTKLKPNGHFNNLNVSFLEIIRKENDEVIMSNLLAYYFRYNPKMFLEFSKEVLNIDDFHDDYEIVRESEGNIDLFIKGSSKVIVIENKIKSGLNGKEDNGTTQLDKYYNYTTEYVRKHKLLEANFYIFLPNYSEIELSEEMKKIYRIIRYKDIYEFFAHNAVEYMDDKYFADFLKAVKNQTMRLSELRFSIMKSRFLEQINRRM